MTTPILTTPYSNVTVTVGELMNLDLTTVWSGADSYVVDGEPVAVEDLNGVISGLVVGSGARSINVQAINSSLASDNTNTDSFILQILSGIPNKVRG